MKCSEKDSSNKTNNGIDNAVAIVLDTVKSPDGLFLYLKNLLEVEFHWHSFIKLDEFEDASKERIIVISKVFWTMCAEQNHSLEYFSTITESFFCLFLSFVDFGGYSPRLFAKVARWSNSKLAYEVMSVLEERPDYHEIVRNFILDEQHQPNTMITALEAEPGS